MTVSDTLRPQFWENPAMKLTESLDRYVASAKRVAPHWTPNLSPGLDRNSARDRLSCLVANPVEEVIDLWTWRDGQGGSPSFWPVSHVLFWGMHFFPLGDVEKRLDGWREDHTEWRHIGESEGGIWPTPLTELVPVFFVQDWQACVWVDCGAGASRGRVFYYGQEGEFEPLDMFASLSDTVDAARYRVESGDWTIDEYGWVDWPTHPVAPSQLDLE